MYFRYLKIFESYIGSKIYSVFSLSVLTVFLESIGIAMLMPVFDREAVSVFSKLMDEIIGYLGLPDSYPSMLSIISVLFLLKGLLNYRVLRALAVMRGELLETMKLKIVKGTTDGDYQKILQKNPGYYSNLANEQVVKAVQCFYALMQTAANFFAAMIYLASALYVQFLFGTLALFSGLIIFFGFRFVNSRIKSVSRQRALQIGGLASLLVDFFGDLDYLKATNQTKKLSALVEKKVEGLKRLEVKNGQLAALAQSMREPLAVLQITIVAIIGTIFFELQLSAMMVSVLLLYRCVNAIFAIQTFWQSAMENVGSVESIDNEIKRLKVNSKKDLIKYKNFTMKENIKLEAISFKYDFSEDYSLENISLTINAGDKIGFVGRSGSGKSTLMKILCGLLEVREGQIVVDGVSHSFFNNSFWQAQIGFVPQGTPLFDGSIRDNVTLFEVPGKVNKTVFLDALKSSAVFEFFADSEQSLDRESLSNYSALSGGQRQRLTIAREFYRQPSILIFDEATSALDKVSERNISLAIEEMGDSVTAVVVSHRKSTIVHLDWVFVLDNGKIVESGTPDDLGRDQNSFYSRVIG